MTRIYNDAAVFRVQFTKIAFNIKVSAGRKREGSEERADVIAVE